VTLRRLFLWIPPIVYMALIFYFSSESEPLPAVTERVWDKALHVVAYAGLGVLFCRAFRGEGIGWTSAILLALLSTSAYGASDEWHQSFIPLRESTVRDWVADTVGASIGAVAYRLRGVRAGPRPSTA
jgi:VanZ family protein